MEKNLLYLQAGITIAAIGIYLYSSILGARFIGGLMDGEVFVKSNYRAVLTGLIAMFLAAAALVAYAYIKTKSPWHPLLLVDGISIVLNATCLHTMYHKFDRKISAWIAMATVFIDANLRFIVLYFWA